MWVVSAIALCFCLFMNAFSPVEKEEDMGKLYECLQKQTQIEENRKDAEDCIKIYNYLKDSTGGVWESQWNTLTTVTYKGVYPNSVMIYKPNEVGRTFLEGMVKKPEEKSLKDNRFNVLQKYCRYSSPSEYHDFRLGCYNPLREDAEQKFKICERKRCPFYHELFPRQRNKSTAGDEQKERAKVLMNAIDQKGAMEIKDLQNRIDNQRTKD